MPPRAAYTAQVPWLFSFTLRENLLLGLPLWARLDARRASGGAGQGEVTCLVVSHRRAALRRPDQIIVLKDGQVEAMGTLE